MMRDSQSRPLLFLFLICCKKLNAVARLVEKGAKAHWTTFSNQPHLELSTKLDFKEGLL